MTKPNAEPARADTTTNTTDWTQIAAPDDHPNQGWREITLNWLAMLAGLGVIFALASLYSVTM